MRNEFDLVIVRVDRIGDYVLWHDTIDAYKKKYAGKKVLLICPGVLLSVTQEEPFFTEILTFDHQKAKDSHKYLFDLFLKMRKITSHEVIYPSWRRSVLGDIIVCGIKSPKKIGMKGIPDVKYSFSTMLNHFFNVSYSKLVDSPQSANEIKAIEHFTKCVIDENYSYGQNKLIVNCPSPVRLKSYAVIAFSAYNKFRIWRIDNFVKLIDRIPSNYDIVLTGYGADDDERAQYIINNVNERERVINMVSKTTIPQLIALIGHSTFVIGNDSSAIHIAAAIQTPSLCILPGAHFNRFVPYPDDIDTIKYKPRAVFYMMDCFGCNYSCTRPITDSYECLRNITVEMAAKELHKLLKEIDCETN